MWFYRDLYFGKKNTSLLLLVCFIWIAYQNADCLSVTSVCRIQQNVAWILTDHLSVNVWQIISIHAQKKVLEKIHDFWKNGYNCYLHLVKEEPINLVLSMRRNAGYREKTNPLILRFLGLRFANFFHCCRIWTKSKSLKATEICSFQNTNLIRSNSMHCLLQTKSQLFFLFIYQLQLNWGYSGATVLATCCWSTPHSFRCQLERPYQGALCRCSRERAGLAAG